MWLVLALVPMTTPFARLRWAVLCLSIVLSGCLGGSSEDPNSPPGRDPILLSLDDDIALGRQVAAQISSDPEQFPILDPAQYPEAYAYLQGMVQSIVNSGQLRHPDAFEWTVSIIHRPDVRNAFAVPGGHLYVYTGLIHSLTQDDELAGVIGHEMAHVDLRHTSRSLEKAYGLQLLTQLILGERSVGTDIAQQLASLSFSRRYEREADLMSVHYLCGSRYEADGAAGFFRQMSSDSAQAGMPEFLSTHPNPGDRVAAIEQRAQSLRCPDPVDDGSFRRFQRSLPR